MIRALLILIFALTFIPTSIAQTADRISFDAGNINQLALIAAIAETDNNLDWLESYWFDDSGDYLVLVFEDYGGNDPSHYGTLVVNMTTLEKQRLPMSDAIPVMVGEQLAIASEGQIVLWNIVTNTQVASLGHFEGDLQQGPGCLMWYDGTHYQVADGLTGEIIGQVETTISPFTNFGFSRDCSRVAMLDVYDDVLLLWDSQSNSVIDVLSPTRNVFAPEYPLTFSADNRYFAWRSEGDKLSVYDFETESYTDLNRASYSRFAARFIGNTLVTYEYNYREPNLIEFWRDGETVYQETMLDITFRGDFMLMLTLENSLELWNGEERIDTIAGVPFVGELIISPQANVVGVVDGQRYWLYDRRTGSSINTTAYDDFFVDELVFSADESLYILPDGSNDRLRLHSIATGEQLAWVPGSFYWISPDGSTLLLDYQFDGGVILYGIPDGRILQPALLGETVANIISRRDQPTFNSPESGIAEGMLYVVGRSADNQFVYDANAEGWVRAGNAYIELFGRIEHLPVIDAAPAWVSATLPDRPTLASITSDTTPIEEGETDFDITTEVTDLPAITPDNAGDVRLLSVIEGGPFAANGDYLATGNGSELKLWDLWTLEELGSYDFGEGVFIWNIHEIVTSGDMIVIRFNTGGNNDSHRFGVWRAGQNLTILDSVYEAPFATQDNRLYYPQGTAINVFNMATMEPITTLSGLWSEARHLKLSPDGRWLAASDGSQYDETRTVNRRVLVWDTFDDFELVHTFENLTDGVTQLNFSGEGRYLAVAGTGFQVWNLEEGQLVVIEEQQRMLYGDFTGDWVYAFSTDSNILNVWSLATGEFHATLNNIGAAYDFDDGDTLLIGRHAAYSQDVWEYPQIWQTWRISTQETLSDTNFAAYYSRFVADGDALLTYTNTALRVWDLRDPENITLAARLDNLDPEIIAVHDAGSVVLVVLYDRSVIALPLTTSAESAYPLHFYRDYYVYDDPVVPVSLWFATDDNVGSIPVATGFTDPALGFMQERINLEYNDERPYFDGSTMIMPVFETLLVFGVPTDSRPAWQPATGHVVPSAIQVKTEPSANGPVLQNISGEIGIGGVYGSEGRTAVYYVPEVNGWVNGDALFVTVDEPMPRLVIIGEE